MLFIGHSAATAANAGKIVFIKDPAKKALAFNYPQWIAFAKYSYLQLKWVIAEKPEAREAYVMGNINEELQEVFDKIDSTFKDYSKEYIGPTEKLFKQ
jgi:hypothetical protein